MRVAKWFCMALVVYAAMWVTIQLVHTFQLLKALIAGGP